MRPARVVVILVFSFGISVVLAGCSREEDPPMVPDENTGGMELTDAGRDRQREQEPEPSPERPALPILDPRDAAFAAERMGPSPVYPIDSRLGSLRQSGLSSAELEAEATARQILTAATQEQPELPEELSRSVRESLLDVSNAASAMVAPRLRLAPPESGDRGEAFVPFRLAGDGVDLVGELVMESGEGGWYIADIQIVESSLW